MNRNLVYGFLSWCLFASELVASEAGTGMLLTPGRGIDGYGYGIGDDARVRCQFNPAYGRCVALAVDRNGRMTYSSATMGIIDGQVVTLSHNSATDERGRETRAIGGLGTEYGRSEVVTHGRAVSIGDDVRAGADIGATRPYRHRDTSPTPGPSSGRTVTRPTQHTAPLAERWNAPRQYQRPLPFAPAGYFQRYSGLQGSPYGR